MISAFVAFLMGLHATQFALQPVITREFLNVDTDKGALVLTCELFKILQTIVLWTTSGTWGEALKGWNFKDSFVTAGVPALIYSTQNLLIQTSYQNLDGVSFNVVNQTKFVFTAVFLYVLYNKRQSPKQIVALILMFLAAVLITTGTGDKAQSQAGTGEEEEEHRENSLLLGYLPCALAAMLSGVASSYSENVFRTKKKKNALLYSIELATFSVVALVVGGVARTFFNENTEFTMISETLAAVQDPRFFIPPFVNAAGGLVVGMLMKYAGAIYKGFATMGTHLLALCLKCILLLLWSDCPLTVSVLLLFAKFTRPL